MGSGVPLAHSQLAEQPTFDLRVHGAIPSEGHQASARWILEWLGGEGIDVGRRQLSDEVCLDALLLFARTHLVAGGSIRVKAYSEWSDSPVSFSVITKRLGTTVGSRWCSGSAT